jgi:REP element-mobilizing transposase RayT
MAHTFTNLLTHVIFSTKDRKPFLTDDIRPRVFAYMGGIVRDLNSKALIINGPADHAHLLISSSPTIALSELMRLLKTNSSKWIHETFSELSDFAWQTGYAAFSVSASNREQVERYIANQEEHHKTVTFQEEFIAFLTRHGISYDPKYIWE